MSNKVFDESGTSFFPEYYSYSFYCIAPMSEEYTRRSFPIVHKFGNYLFATYLCSNTHSINALLPRKLEFARSSDNWETYEILPMKVINDGGTMREIDQLQDGFQPLRPQFVYADSKMWAIIPTFNLTENPPNDAADWTSGKTFISYSSNYGNNWSELIELDAQAYVSSSKPIVVGNELWFTGYNVTGVTSEAHSWLLRYNYITSIVGSKTQIDSTWTDLSTSEPCILEHTTGKYMCVARVNWNAAYPGAEGSHKGCVIAYSDDGLDWSNYTYYDEGTNYPNQPHLFKYKGYIYFSRGCLVLYGQVADEINWIQRYSHLTPWYNNYAYVYRTLYNSINRYDPREAYKTQLRTLYQDGSISFEVIDADKDLLMCAGPFRESYDGGYLGESWLCLIKPCTVDAEGYHERLIFTTEIPGDLNTSNSITIYNTWVELGDTVNAYLMDINNYPDVAVQTIIANKQITFTSDIVLNNKKIVYEIIKN